MPPVDVISFGSPCQNMSLIGNRSGLAGEKSNLFYEAIRIIKEMRCATENRYPSIALWENVMGSLSSNNRRDFGSVLSAFTDAEIPMPASGRWANAGVVRNKNVDLAWRLMDAQYWSSPPLARRQRIFTVADFTGRRALQILFKPREMQYVFKAGGSCRLSAAPGDRGSSDKTRGKIPQLRPFQLYRMRGAASDQYHVQFVDSFGKQGDPFPTLLAGTTQPFAFWYEDDPLGGFVRILTETECERLLGLPDGWTEYGALGEKISSTQRYMALGNSVALPCACYIMAGIREALS